MTIKDYLYDFESANNNSEYLWDSEVKHRLPQAVLIETISTCNRTCSYCPNSIYKRKFAKMEDLTFRSIIDQLQSWKFKGNIQPTFYSEPLLDDRLINLFSYAKEKLPDCTINLATNGDFLTPQIVDELIEKAFTSIRITQHDKVYKKENDLNKYSKSIDKISILRPHTWKPHNRGGYVHGNAQKKLRLQCIRYSHLVIDCYGNTALCCNDYFAENGYGNITEFSLKEIWKRSEAVRRDLYTGNHMSIKLCQKCVGYKNGK